MIKVQKNSAIQSTILSLIPRYSKWTCPKSQIDQSDITEVYGYSAMFFLKLGPSKGDNLSNLSDCLFNYP